MRDFTCAHCGARWVGPTQATPTWCTPECADAWMDGHPDEKQRRNWMTRDDVVDRMLTRAGLLPVQRATPPRDDN